MLDLGFYDDIRELITYIPIKRQTLFFSATISEKIKDLAYSLVKNAIRIQISPKDPVSRNVDHAVMFIAMDDKRYFLERLVNEHPDSKILVFVRTKVRAERVHAAMLRVGIQTITMHGGKEQEDRLKVMERFRTGEVKVLIATDVSARGINVEGIDYVLNYDLPDQPENYVHRVGRTGRGNHHGHAVSFCSPEEKKTLLEIEKYLDKPVKVIDVKKEVYNETLLFTEDTKETWQDLLENVKKEETKGKSSGPKKKPKK
jgi:ATP-dependent RNA helicase RhlE